MSEQLNFVARQNELAALNEAIQAVWHGHGQLRFVSGKAGAGKTALINEFGRRAQKQDPNLLLAVGTCDPQTGPGDPYLPFREILETLIGSEATTVGRGETQAENSSRLKKAVSFSLEALVEVGPDLIGTVVPFGKIMGEIGKLAVQRAGWLDKLSKVRTGQEQFQQELTAAAGMTSEQIFEQYINFLKNLSEKFPLVLILDDLQWADDASINLLFRLGRRLENHAILLLGTYRQDEVGIGRLGQRHPLDKVLIELKRYYGEIFIDLDQATAHQGREFVDALLDREPNRLGKAFREALFQHTEGHPLFTVELLHDLQQHGSLTLDEQGYWITADLDWQRLPARVEGVIEERFQMLAADLQESLRVASVEGEHFTAEVTAKIQARDVLPLIRQLSGDLQKVHQLIFSVDIRRAGQQRLSIYRFAHSLMRMYLYNELDVIEQAYLHESVGQALESLYGDSADEIAVQLALHFERAEIPERARHYLALAGEQAAAQFANELALDYFRRALELTTLEELEEQYRLLNARVNVLDVLGQRDAQQADLHQLYTLAEKLAVPYKLARVMLKQGRLALATGQYEAAGERAAGALEFADDERLADLEWVALFADSHQLWGEAARLQGNPRSAHHHLQQALKLAQKSGYQAGEMKSLESLGTLAWSVGDYLEAHDFYARAVALARELGDRRSEWSLLSNLGVIAKERGDPVKACEYYAEALSIAREVGDRLGESTALTNLGESQLNLGDYSAARETLLPALSLVREINDRNGEGIVLGNLCECARLLGDYAQAEVFAEQALAIFKTTGFSMGQGIVLGNWAQLALATGRGRQARDLAEASLAIAREIEDSYGEALGLNSLGDALRELELLDESAATYQQAEAIWQELEDEAGLLHARLGRALILAAARTDDRSGEILALLPVDALLKTSHDGAGSQILLVDYALGWQLLERLGDPRAGAVLAQTHRQLLERADRISDPADRQSFLENVPENQRIQQNAQSSGV